MIEIKQRSVFIHIDVPGQEDHASDLANDFNFPTIQQLGEELNIVLDQLKVKLVVCFGEGAGANVLARFALAHPARVLGLILIHCIPFGAGVMEYFKDRFMNWKLQTVGMNASTEQYLVLHRFGAEPLEEVNQTLDVELDDDEQLEVAENKDKLIQEFTENLKKRINARNLRRYVESYMVRKDIMGLIELHLKGMDVLLVAGAKSAHIQAVSNMYMKMDKQKTSFLKVDSAGDVLMEAPEKLSQSLHLFVKGLGFLTSVALPGVERHHGIFGHKTLWGSWTQTNFVHGGLRYPKSKKLPRCKQR
ncbi:uncharacterized protein ZK1073.1 [Caerostris extrusa]|uniref:Uncharacterized protein ZK1073.1 n=1 Tax=Caerostris extrusa TaxID=172846 RepID=A0AAV4XLM3_CAEEX|nr:uncharacterized protein ZK1073.1 [Caerostris extrusa]